MQLRLRALLLVGLFFTLSGCRPARARRMRAARPTPAPVQGVQEHVVKVAGASRTYLRLDGASGTVAAPLVIVLHGGGGTGASMLPRWEAKAKTEKFIVAAPNGVGRSDRVGTWNAGGCCGYAMTSNSDDVRFVEAMIADIKLARPIDMNRIYVAGMSNGGMMAYKLGVALGDRLAGIAIVAGAMFGEEVTPTAALPVLIMHGLKDPNVAYNGGTSANTLIAKQQTKPFKPVSYAVQFWVNADGCGATPTIVTKGDVTTERYGNCRANGEVLHYKLASAGHTWPGTAVGSVALERERYDEISATDLIWDFFRAHAKP